MKKLFSLILTLFVTCMFAIACYASESKVFPESLRGKWVDAATGQTFEFSETTFNNLTLNNFIVDDGDEKYGSGKFIIQTSSVPYTYKLSWNVVHGNIPFIFIDGFRTLWRKPADFSYRETMGGLHLGMLKSEVESTYGKAPVVDYKFFSETWYYPDTKWAVGFDGGILTKIAIPKGSTRCFDNSGMKADNKPEEFKTAYNDTDLKAVDKVVLGPSEYILFNNSDKWKHFLEAEWVELNSYGF